MHTSKQDETWKLISLPATKKAIGCRRVYTTKLSHDGTLTCLKTRLVQNRYSQTYSIDYQDTLSNNKDSFWLLIHLLCVTRIHTRYKECIPS